MQEWFESGKQSSATVSTLPNAPGNVRSRDIFATVTSADISFQTNTEDHAGQLLHGSSFRKTDSFIDRQNAYTFIAAAPAEQRRRYSLLLKVVAHETRTEVRIADIVIEGCPQRRFRHQQLTHAVIRAGDLRRIKTYRCSNKAGEAKWGRQSPADPAYHAGSMATVTSKEAGGEHADSHNMWAEYKYVSMTAPKPSQPGRLHEACRSTSWDASAAVIAMP